MASIDNQTPKGYDDFEINLIALQTDYTYMVLARSNAGQVNGQMTLDPGDQEWHRFLARLDAEDTDLEILVQLGTKLFDALFSGDIEDNYRSSLGHAMGTGKGLRLRLILAQAPKIAALPWEFLHDRQRDLFLGISSTTPLSRFIQPQQVFPPPPPPSEALRILTVVSNPDDAEELELAELDVQRELDTIQEALEPLKSQNLVEIVPPLRHAVRSDISKALREHRPHVLHFIGHGIFKDEQGQLIIEDQDHMALEIEDVVFRELLEGHADTRLVVLNACQGATRSAGNAMVGIGPQVVSRGVPAVVAMQYPIWDEAAIIFARELYSALAYLAPVDTAIAEARRALYADFGTGQRDWGAPVLFMRDSQGQLFAPPTADEARRDQQRDRERVHEEKTMDLPFNPDEISSTKLRRAMVEAFDKPGLQMLCATLADQYRQEGLPDSYGVEYDNLRGEAPPSKILHLVDWHRRHGRLDNLITRAIEERPDLKDKLAS
jgi:hypothetical protein